MKLVWMVQMGGEEITLNPQHIVFIKAQIGGSRSSAMLCTGVAIELRTKFVEAVEIWRKGLQDEQNHVADSAAPVKRRTG